jgi:hypothetical protein
MRAAARAGITCSELCEAGRTFFDEAALSPAPARCSGTGSASRSGERSFVRRHEHADEDVRLRPGISLYLEPILAPVEDGVLRGLFVVEDMIAVTGGAADVLSEGLDRELARMPGR